MRHPALVLALLATILLAASPTSAAPSHGGIYLKWNDCVLGGGVADKTFSCDTDVGTSIMVGSFIPPSPGFTDTIYALTGEDAFVSLISASPALPDWWAFQADGCRNGSIVVSAKFDSVGLFSCSTPLDPVYVGGGSIYIAAPPEYPLSMQPNTARLEAVFAIPPADAKRVPSDSEWYAFCVVIRNDHTIAGTCAGCSIPVCIAFSELNLSQPGGFATFLTTSPSPGGNMITWQGGLGANCALVPVKRTTWGELKSLYR
jgi:hypothetical protein